MITDPQDIAQIFIATVRSRQADGDLEPGDHTPETLYGINAGDIKGVHLHKSGTGDGVFFRLDDGRVIDRYGAEHDADPALYDTVNN